MFTQLENISFLRKIRRRKVFKPCHTNHSTDDRHKQQTHLFLGRTISSLLLLSAFNPTTCGVSDQRLITQGAGINPILFKDLIKNLSITLFNKIKKSAGAWDMSIDSTLLGATDT